MNFQVRDYRKIPDLECLEDVIAVAKKMGKRTVSYDEYSKHGKYNYGTLLKKFGPWNKMLKRAGLEISTRRSMWKSDAEKEGDLFENLTNVWIKLGRQPKYTEMRYPLSLYSGSVYVRHFSTWTASLTAFGAYKKNEAAGVSANDKAISPRVKSRVEFGRVERDVRYASLRLKFSVFARDGYRCTCCGKSPATHQGVVLHCDHVQPWSKGGRTTLENLTTLCSECNIGKGDRIVE